MSRYAVFGGTGLTGRHVVAELLSRGDSVVAFSHNKRRLDAIAKTGAEAVMLDLVDVSVDELVGNLAECDGIVFLAGSTDPRAVFAIDQGGSIAVAAAAERAGVSRFVQISSIGAGDRIPHEIDTPQFAPYYEAKRAADANLRASGLQWTIIEPGWLVDRTPTGRIRLGTRNVPMGEIARADVAATLIAVLDDDRTIRRQWQVVGGETPIAQAIGELVSE